MHLLKLLSAALQNLSRLCLPKQWLNVEYRGGYRYYGNFTQNLFAK